MDEQRRSPATTIGIRGPKRHCEACGRLDLAARWRKAEWIRYRPSRCRSLDCRAVSLDGTATIAKWVATVSHCRRHSDTGLPSTWYRSRLTPPRSSNWWVVGSKMRPAGLEHEPPVLDETIVGGLVSAPSVRRGGRNRLDVLAEAANPTDSGTRGRQHQCPVGRGEEAVRRYIAVGCLQDSFHTRRVNRDHLADGSG